MSRRMKGRHAKVRAQPHAKPSTEKPVELTDENSVPDTNGLGIRYPKQLNTRAWVTAGDDESEQAPRRRRKKSTDDDQDADE